jgi:hypothetical protein
MTLLCLARGCNCAIVIFMDAPSTLAVIVRKYLDWCNKHRAPRSVEWYEVHLDSFLAHLGEHALMPVADFKPYHVVEWVDSHPRWGYSSGERCPSPNCMA